jgi:hypothetical protein
MTNAKPITVQESAAKGWVFVALKPEQLFTIHSLLRLEIKKGSRRKHSPKTIESLLMAEYILEGVCTSLVGMSAEE